MFQILLGVLILASNFLGVSRASAETDAGSGPGAMTMPIRGRARWAAFTLGLALLPAAANAQNAYIPNYVGNTVSVIDTASNTVVATSPVGAPGPYAVAVTPDGTKVYAGHYSNAVSVIDTASNTLITTIQVGGGDFGVAVTPDSTKVYVTNAGNNTVSVIATASNTVIATISGVTNPLGVAVTPDGAKVYVTNQQDPGTVSVIATATDTVVATIPVGSAPQGVAVTPDGAKIYVVNHDSDSVSVIDTATDTVVGPPIPVGHFPNGVAVTPDDAKVYVTNGADGVNTVSVIATASNTVIATISVGGQPFGVAVTPDGTKVYVANSFDNTVSVIDTATNAVTTTIPVGTGPIAFGKFIGGPRHGSPPVAVNESATTTANTPVTINLSAGATGNPTSAALVGAPVGGTVSGFPATTVTFTPTTAFSGAASFQFTLANAGGTSNTATATITITGAPPTAVPESATTAANTPVTIDLTAGASGNPTSAALVGTPVGGTVSGFPSTTVTFTPTTGFSGPAKFQFTLANAAGSSNTATATITVTPSPLAPVAIDQAVSTTAGTPVPIALAAHATGNPTSAAIVSGPTHGVLKFISKTKVSYTLTACFVGTDSFQFTLANAFGTSNVATATITVTAVSDPTTAVHLVDPYLLKKVISNFDEKNIDPTPLYRVQKWSTVQASGLLADNTSAAIAVIQTNDCANDVSLTTTNGTTLADYSQDFLTKSPASGLPGLPIPVAKFQNIGGSFFAAALVQAPQVGGTYRLSTLSSANPITVTAVQGSRQPPPATMSLVIPPVVLVHGIWGHSTDLQYYDDYLSGYDPYQLYPKGSGYGIASIQYRNDIAFDDLRAGGGPKTLNKAITAIWALLDGLHFAGGRVDVVAHSMGGLVARALAGQQNYTQWLRGRDVAQATSIHQIITIDTPENGTALAKFLLDNKDAHYKNVDSPEVLAVWEAACFSPIPILMTVTKCFDKMGQNIINGAVASLEPGSTSLTNKALPGPADPKWIWNAISAVVPQPPWIFVGKNALQIELEDLIAGIYLLRELAPTISSPQILGDNGQDDAIVPLASQNPTGAAQFHTFPGLAHIPASSVLLLDVIGGYYLPPATNDSVVDSPDIANLICSWLIFNGAASCNPPPGAVVQAKTQGGPALASKSPVLPINATIITYAQMNVQIPQNLQLATPFELAVANSKAGLAQLAVTQQDEMGHHAKQEKPAISRVVGNTSYLTVIPKLLGSVTFTVQAVFKDGSVSSQDVTLPIGVPSVAPKLFRGDQFPEFSLSLKKGGDVAPLQPEAYYASIPDRIDKWGHSHPVAVNLAGRVDYQIAPTGTAPILQLEKDTYGSVIGVRALRPDGRGPNHGHCGAESLTGPATAVGFEIWLSTFFSRGSLMINSMMVCHPIKNTELPSKIALPLILLEEVVLIT